MYKEKSSVFILDIAKVMREHMYILFLIHCYFICKQVTHEKEKNTCG